MTVAPEIAREAPMVCKGLDLWSRSPFTSTVGKFPFDLNSVEWLNCVAVLPSVYTSD
jgi:hypothetical protein